MVMWIYGGCMQLLIGIGVVVVVAWVATWFNDNVPVGDYIADESVDPPADSKAS